MEAFNKVKSILASTELLVHYDLGKDLIISFNASPYGVAAVLAHKMIDGTKRPMMYTHKLFTTAEKR